MLLKMHVTEGPSQCNFDFQNEKKKKTIYEK